MLAFAKLADILSPAPQSCKTSGSLGQPLQLFRTFDTYCDDPRLNKLSLKHQCHFIYYKSAINVGYPCPSQGKFPTLGTTWSDIPYMYYEFN
jgi:hypothetical protein